ncbi:MAG: DNA methyltransferase [Candidatus Uhrbacteria bacterium]
MPTKKPLPISWHNETRRVNDLVPFDKNPRTLSPQQTEALKASLQKFNLAEIPAVTPSGRIAAGHQRVKVLQLLGRGEEEIDVRVSNRELTDEEYKEYLLRSNANHGSWDYDLLKEFDADLLLNIGFDDFDLSNIWDSQLAVEDDDFQIEKELAKIKTTDIKPGDLFSFGLHKLICGDSTDPEIVKKLVGKERPATANIDFVYNISLDYDGGIGGKKGKYGGHTNDHKSDTEYKKFIKQIIVNALSVMSDNCHFFGWSDQKYIGLFQEIYREVGLENKRVCLWIKNNQNATPQVAFNKCYEPCIYGTKGKPFLSNIKNFNEIMNPEIGTGNRTLEDILDLLDIWLVKRLPGQQYHHATEKPPSLHEKFLRRCTRPGDIVLDLCAGSGSLAISCEQLKRRAYLCDIEPIFCQLILNRYEDLTGQKAKKLN